MNTQAVSVQHVITLAVVTLALSMSTVVVAQQQQPLTGQMMSGQTSTPSTTATTTAPVATQSTSTQSPALDDAATYSPTQFGDTTRHVLQLQVDGSLAGKHLPMLGDEAGTSYQRYLKSFEHPIPEFFQTTVAQNPSNGR